MLRRSLLVSRCHTGSEVSAQAQVGNQTWFLGGLGESSISEEQGKRQYAAKLKKLEQEIREWKTRCMYAVVIAGIAVFLFAR